MWKTVVGLVVFLSLVDVARGKEFKGNLDPLKKLSVSQPECDLPSYFSSAEEFDSLKTDLKEFCPSALSKSKLSDEMKEKSLVLCQLLLVQLNRTCASGQDAKLSPIAYATPLDKVKVCQKKAVLSANNNLLPLINIPADNPLQIDAKNLCKQIIDDETTKLVRLIYRLHDLLSKINPKKGSRRAFRFVLNERTLLSFRSAGDQRDFDDEQRDFSDECHGDHRVGQRHGDEFLGQCHDDDHRDEIGQCNESSQRDIDEECERHRRSSRPEFHPPRRLDQPLQRDKFDGFVFFC